MRLQYYLLTESRSKKLTPNAFNTILHKNCSQIIENYKNSSNVIYRGINNNNIHLYINPLKHTRVSANTRNYYTIMFDEILPSWKDWPKRSKSIICSTNFHSASSYGNVYKIYPFNNSKIGFCPQMDIWLSFMDTFGEDLSYVEKIFRELSMYFLNDKLRENKQSIVTFIKDIDNELEDYRTKFFDFYASGSTMFSGETTSFLQKYYKSKKSMFDFLNTIFNPNINRFSKGNPSMKLLQNKELWIEGECLLIGDLSYE